MKTKSSRALTALIFFSFICYGLFTCLFGSLSPLMMQHYKIGTAEFGLFTTMLGVGGIAVALLLAIFGERFSPAKIILAGAALLALASLAIGLRPGYLWVVLLALVAGIAYTCIDIMGNAALSAMPNSKTVIPMAQTMFSVGSTLGPMLCAMLINPELAASFRVPFLAVGALTALACLCGPMSLRRSAAAEAPKPSGKTGWRVFGTGRFWVLLAGASCYNIFTMGVSAWLPAYFNSYRGVAANDAAMTLTVFFAGVLVLRFFGPLVFKHMRPQTAFILFSIVSAVAMAAALLVTNFTVCMILIALSGGCTAFCMAAVIMMGCALFPENRTAASSTALFSYNIGAVIAASTVGWLIAALGYQLPMLLLCGVYLLGVAIIFLLSRRCKEALKDA